MGIFSLFRPTEGPSIRERSAAVVAADYADALGLTPEQIESCAEFAAYLFRSGLAPTLMQAIDRAKDKARALKAGARAIEALDIDAAAPGTPDQERHSNLGWVPVHHFRRINQRDLPQTPMEMGDAA